MSNYEEIKTAIMRMDGVTSVCYGYSEKTDCYCLHFTNNDRKFYLIPSSTYDCHFYNSWLEDYWVIDYSFYSPKDVIYILKKLFFLLPQYDTDNIVDEMEALADAMKLDYKYVDDDDQWEMLASILAKRYINDNHLLDDEYGVLYTVIEHACINAVIGFWPEKRRQEKREEGGRKKLKREWKEIVKRRNKRRK
jgi:hypothetical protein